ncbi:MAG TPA: LPXTG cell wall anchor domain-containing protein [Bryobacteraceae bacterium]|nr:LPXTG cell wall anchor domain-containing protein [Bryobacteraceae bacterium]
MLALICGLGIAGSIGVIPSQADEWNKRTTLTVNEPIQITDTVLDPGKYVLMLANSNSDRHIVQIYDANQTHLINTVMAIPNYRLQPTGNSRFMFWETPPGTARALRAWFYPGDNFGQEFTYPKHPMVLQAKATVPSVTQPPAEPAPAPAPVTTPEPAPQASAKPAPEEAAPAEQPQPEIAQNNPPAAPAPSSSSQSEAQEQPKPQELPQTASPYPLIGLGGGVLLGLAGLLRLKRVTGSDL